MDLREILQNLDDRKLTQVPTPEWPELDGQLYACKMGGRQRGQYSAAVALYSANNGPDFMALVIACGAVKADGSRAFEDGDYLWLRDKDADAQARLFAKIDELNILSANAQEGLEKNSDAPADSESTSQ